MKNILSLLFLSFMLNSCGSISDKTEADLLVFNAMVYTVNDSFPSAEAFAVQDGKFLKIASEAELREKYNFKDEVNAQGKAVFPGLIDAHTHFYRFGLQLQTVDLRGTKSFDEVISRIVEFQKNKNTNYIIGRGWDQNDWETKEFPNKDTLDILFPDTPVAITRIDGHAMLVNNAALKKAGIDENTPSQAGQIDKIDGKITGILIDNPMGMVSKTFAVPDANQQKQALLEAQKICFSYGLTTVDDAGIDRETIEMIDSLQKTGDLKMRIYAMISNSQENLDYYLSKPLFKTERLNVRSVKFYGDGALGSRGAALKEEYSDKPGHFGAMLSPIAELKSTAARIANSEYQMNTHAIGDSANYIVLKTYDSLLQNKPNRRWRVEHSQVIDSADFHYFSKNIIPSVQPTHATSDMYWAKDRLGEKREKGAYAFKKLLDVAGVIALGTDFPVEEVNPFYTFYAAVARKDLQQFPDNGYRMEEALSREETLKGMTIWAAYSNFEENEKGSIEAGKFADFVILDRDIMKVSEDEIPDTKVIGTYLNGEKVY